MDQLSKSSRHAASLVIAATIGLAMVAMLFTGGRPSGGEASKLMATSPGLGAAQSFAVMAAAGVTNTGPTTVNGDLGTHPTAAVTGFFGTTSNEGPGTVTGQIHQANGTALSARTAVTSAYNNAFGQPTNFAVGTELGGTTLVPGVYASGTFGITAGAGALTLNGSATDVWIFKAGSTLITSASSTVLLTGGAQACNVFWQIGSSATLGASSTFQGTILANTSISVGNSATIVGRLLAGAVADTGAVTLDNDTIAISLCAIPPVPPTATPAPPTATPTATLVPATATATATAIAATATAVAPTATLVPATATAIAATATAIAATATAIAPTATPVPAIPTATPADTSIVVTPTPSAPVGLPNAGDGGCSASPLACYHKVSGLVAKLLQVSPH